MRDVFNVGLFEAQAIKRFEQIAGCTQALVRCVEDGTGTGRGVDDEDGRFAVAGFEWTIAVLHLGQSYRNSGSLPGRSTPVFSRAANYEGGDVARQYGRNGQVL
jgi:hypothetical protein